MQKLIFKLLLCFSLIVGGVGPTSIIVAQQFKETNATQFGHDSNWQSSMPVDSENQLSVKWEIEIGRGRSQVVGIGDEIYVTTGATNKADGIVTLEDRTFALDARTGKQKWSSTQTSVKNSKQENFSGEPMSPQATPAIAGPKLITLGFTGQLTCLNRDDGKMVWQKDLVKDMNAEPVQFGFSSSPITDPAQPDRVYVMAAGENGGFFCLRVKDGSTIWKSKCETFSYATPAQARLGDVEQWILVTENEILSVAKNDGRTLWKHELAETGLTNVPTPLVVDDSRLIISGQGCTGTRCLKVLPQGDGWKIQEAWHAPKLQYFYTNWLKLNDDIVVGCTDKFMAAFDVNDGTLLGRWRGYGNGNAAIVNQRLMIMGGKGNLNVLSPIRSDKNQMTGLTANQKFKVLSQRCWTPLTVIGGRILIRGGDRLVCLTVDSSDATGELENLLTEPQQLDFERTSKAD